MTQDCTGKRGPGQSAPRARPGGRGTDHEARITFLIHRNPDNKILHTALVGEMNGYLEAMTLGTGFHGQWGKFGGPRAYTKWVQPAAVCSVNVPARSRSADGGTSIMRRVAELALPAREQNLLGELQGGNLPEFLRRFRPVRIKGKDTQCREHSVCLYLMPDYLAVGSDRDFVRLPITPMTAQAVADRFECSLPTRKMVDEIYRQADVKLEPKPLTEKREALETFVRHNSIIEEQRRGKSRGALVAGVKKDVVITNLPKERPDHVAIYGWHKLDGTPIQPLNTVHVNTYVDYSHGIRLVKRTILLDGNPRDIRDVLADPVLHSLLSDEGPIGRPYYRREGHPAAK